MANIDAATDLTFTKVGDQHYRAEGNNGRVYEIRRKGKGWAACWQLTLPGRWRTDEHYLIADARSRARSIEGIERYADRVKASAK